MSALSYAGHELYLGVTVERAHPVSGGWDDNWAPLVTTSVADDCSLWQLAGIQGTAGFYLTNKKAGALQEAVPEAKHHFPSIRFGSEALSLYPLDSMEPEFVLYADDVGDGYVAINNHDKSRVLDVRGGNRTAGASIFAWPWNGGENQRWRVYAA